MINMVKELKDLGFSPLKREDCKLCLTYGEGYGDTFPIEYRIYNHNDDEFLFLGVECDFKVLTSSQILSYVREAVECISAITERHHARCCVRSTN